MRNNSKYIYTLKDVHYAWHQSLNLLKWFNIYHELRLSVALEMIPPIGVGALNTYSRPIDKYTRFICYSYYSRTEYISDDEFKSLKENVSSTLDTCATHVIVFVNWGISAVIILQLSPDDALTDKIDHAIKNLCFSLSNDHISSVLPKNDIHYLEKILHTEVFSNILDLSNIKSIIDFYRDIPRFKNNSNLHEPHNYNLCPIQYFYARNNGKQGIFNKIQEEHVHRIENYLIQLSFNFKRLATATDQDFPNLQQHLKDQLFAIRARWSNLKEMYKYEIQRLRDLIISVRRGEIDQNKVLQALNNNEKEQLTKSIEDLDYDLNVMQKKEHLIGDLLQKKFEYQNASKYGVKNGDDEKMIAHKLLADGKCNRIFCFNDILRNKNQSEWNRLDTQVLKELKDNPQLRIIYVDFSYCSYELDRFLIFRKDEKNNNITVPEPVTPSTPSTPSGRPKTDEIINILLLGESGVGKSTFINAFVNYLAFKTLEQAQNNPIVLIPVSFIMTIDDDFKERTVTFGGQDSVSNEDHDHPGQSVTQRCKSYVFTLKDGNNRGKKLRIIDTPGIGDVRGLAQDDVNMQHILSYMNNLTHLNAVCILMKPNNARLNIFFRSCFIQLFDLLGENARDKIIFCFTNARSTFYAPGNTAPLLKKLLESLPVKRVPFTKENTFCFDSESFRYLVAVQNGIKFSKSQEEEYKESWDKSSIESQRFLEYIRTKMTSPLVPGECHSMKDAQLRISLMIRPMLETMRNILRNIVLWNAGSRTVSIELCPTIIKGTTAICLTCPRQFLQFNEFWITADGLHVFHNKCRTCGCSPDDHYPIDYELRYKPGHRPESNSSDDMTNMLDGLCQASAEFGHFLFEAVDTSQKDLFLTGLKRMMKEESGICANKKSCHLNLTLLSQLEKLKKNYEDTKKKLAAKQEHIQLSDIYDKIRIVSKYPMIELQMNAVKEWQKFMIKSYEYEVLD